MNRTPIYFWDIDEVTVHLVIAPGPQAKKKRHLGQYCVDTYHGVDEPTMRYGKFMNYGWTPVPLDSFPKEFRVHLLLLGVA